jgi:hypothetical protein
MGGNRAAIDRNERLVSPRRPFVDGNSGECFTRARFADRFISLINSSEVSIADTSGRVGSKRKKVRCNLRAIFDRGIGCCSIIWFD